MLLSLRLQPKYEMHLQGTLGIKDPGFYLPALHAYLWYCG